MSKRPEPFGLDANAWADHKSFEIAERSVLDIQDQYVVPHLADIERKWTAIRAQLDRSHTRASGVWMINYWSGTSGRIPDLDHLLGHAFALDHADPYSDQVVLGAGGITDENQRLLDYVRAARPGRTLGTILMEYAGDPDGGELIEALIRLNVQPA